MDTKPQNDPPLPAPAEPVLDTPFCGNLRSKKYFLLDELATDASQYMDGSGHCWCYRTQQVVGPDGRPVDAPACTPGRSCYISALADVV